VLSTWISYRDFWFESNESNIHEADSDKFQEIAEYMAANPSLILGIDASANPRATKTRDIDLANSRVKSIRDGLMSAGVSADRITVGMFGVKKYRRNGRVEVLLTTREMAQAE
jgi:outer membrane protein OmpA-like peptidoglycan-associated protein